MPVDHEPGVVGGRRAQRGIVEVDRPTAVRHRREAIAPGHPARLTLRPGLHHRFGSARDKQLLVVLAGHPRRGREIVWHLVEIAALMGVGGVHEDFLDGNAPVQGADLLPDRPDQEGPDHDHVAGEEDDRILRRGHRQGGDGDRIEHPFGEAQMELPANADRLVGGDVPRGPANPYRLRGHSLHSFRATPSAGR